MNKLTQLSAKSFRWYSTVQSANNLEFSVLATVESVCAVTLSLLLAWHFKTYTHLVVAIVVAPLLLLRTEESVKLGLNWFVKFWKFILYRFGNAMNSLVKLKDNIISFFNRGTKTANNKFPYHYINICIIVNMIYTKICLSINTIKIYLSGEYYPVLVLDQREYDLLTKLVKWSNKLAPVFILIRLLKVSLELIRLIIIFIFHIIMCVWYISTNVTFPVLIMICYIMFIFAVICALLLLVFTAIVGSLIIKFLATTVTCSQLLFIYYPFMSCLRAIPLNWYRIVFATDMRHPPELLPGIESNSEKNNEFIKNISICRFSQLLENLDDEIDVSDKMFVGIPLFFLFFSALLYRWSLKSSALFYLPFLWIINTVPCSQSFQQCIHKQPVRSWSSLVFTWILIFAAWILIFALFVTVTLASPCIIEYYNIMYYSTYDSFVSKACKQYIESFHNIESFHIIFIFTTIYLLLYILYSQLLCLQEQIDTQLELWRDSVLTKIGLVYAWTVIIFFTTQLPLFWTKLQLQEASILLLSQHELINPVVPFFVVFEWAWHGARFLFLSALITIGAWFYAGKILMQPGMIGDSMKVKIIWLLRVRQLLSLFTLVCGAYVLYETIAWTEIFKDFQ